MPILTSSDRKAYGRKIRAHMLENAVPSGFGDIHGFSYEVIYKVKGVPSLKYQCRRRIRFNIKLKNPCDITRDIDKLPLPRRMEEFLQ